MLSDLTAETKLNVKGPSAIDRLKDWIGSLTGKIEYKKVSRIFQKGIVKLPGHRAALPWHVPVKFMDQRENVYPFLNQRISDG